MRVEVWRPPSVAINSPVPPHTDFCLTHLSREGGTAYRVWLPELRAIPWLVARIVESTRI